MRCAFRNEHPTPQEVRKETPRKLGFRERVVVRQNVVESDGIGGTDSGRAKEHSISEGKAVFFGPGIVLRSRLGLDDPVDVAPEPVTRWRS
jgi:hypothetical protein